MGPLELVLIPTYMLLEVARVVGFERVRASSCAVDGATVDVGDDVIVGKVEPALAFTLANWKVDQLHPLGEALQPLGTFFVSKPPG